MPQFRTKARAVELLGKGQIADLPTAISELWKNGYDAYGDNLQARLYLSGYQDHDKPVFVLSDDGKGMSSTDILDKWFVLGTDSKSRNQRDIKGPETLWKEPRIKMGEKGIGRLAVAYLGPQMIMLTKKINHPVEMVYFDWRILENYNLFLSDINIPLKPIEKADQFNTAFSKLKTEFLKNFPQYNKNEINPWKEQMDLRQSIISDSESLIVPNYIIEDILEPLLNKPTKTNGTYFIIFQPEQQILELRNFTKKDEKEDYIDETSVNYTVSTLTGLFNLFKTTNPDYKTFFWIYEPAEGRYDLLSAKAFFEPKDFDDCDHLIDGEFDSEGKFTGSVRIYNKPVNHKFQPIRKKGKTSYGKFTIRLGYVQFAKDESMINEERKRVFEEKLELYSGLYIYRDGFRVLPYGRSDADFLEFEERRSKSAGENFFSKRRMFGYIEISRNENEKLIDKSSREGFINNQAYRDFKTDLIAFFKDLAKKYFGTKAETTYKEEQQEQLKKQALAEKQEHQRDIEARKNFAKQLTLLPREIAQIEKEYERYIAELQEKFRQPNLIYSEIQDLLSNIEDLKIKLSSLKLDKPSRFKPTELQQKKFHDYNKVYKGLTRKFTESDNLISKVRAKLKAHELFLEFQDKAEFYKNALAGFYEEHAAELQSVFHKIESEFNTEKHNLLGEFDEKYESIIPNQNNTAEINNSLRLLEKIFTDSNERMLSRVTPFLNHLRRISFDVNEDDLVGFYKMQFENMKDEWNKTYELAQLGIAVEIIDHQFNTLYSQLADSIKSIREYIQVDKIAERTYKTLVNAFEHLQDNYKLLQPLYRTTGRIRNEITGIELKEYVEEFFKERLQENKVNFNITTRGKKWVTNSYESVFKPVLINIVNNALYWLQRADQKEIKIDSNGDELIIMNSGEPIEDYQLEDIFKLFFSNRPKGRGIGLYLAKQSLNGIGYEIEASNDPKYNQLNGACFIIKPL